MSKRCNWLLRIAASIIGAVLSLYVAHVFNPFSLMTVIPQDKVYDVCIAVYFSITELFVGWGVDIIEEKISYLFTDIEAVLSHRCEEAVLQSRPLILFNELDMSEVALTIKIRGSRKNISGVKVILPRISQADYQLSRKTIGASINNSGDLCIELSAICGQPENVNMAETFLFTLQRAPVDDNAQITITSVISPKDGHRWINFYSNTAIVKLEGR